MSGKRDVESEIMKAWRAFASCGGQLPQTNDGKVNVSGLTRALGLGSSDVQYFHKKNGLRAAINDEALRQGLRPIGARSDEQGEVALLAAIDSLVKADGRLPRDGETLSVAELCRQLDLRPSDTHLLYRDAVLVVINALAQEQGLSPLMCPGEIARADAALEDRLSAVSARASKQAQVSAERSAAVDALLEELVDTKRENVDLRWQVASLKERLRIIEAGGVLPRL